MKKVFPFLFLFTAMFAREAAGERGMETGFVGEAEDEIDKLFGS